MCLQCIRELKAVSVCINIYTNKWHYQSDDPIITNHKPWVKTGRRCTDLLFANMMTGTSEKYFTVVRVDTPCLVQILIICCHSVGFGSTIACHSFPVWPIVWVIKDVDNCSTGLQLSVGAGWVTQPCVCVCVAAAAESSQGHHGSDRWRSLSTGVCMNKISCWIWLIWDSFEGREREAWKAQMHSDLWVTVNIHSTSTVSDKMG